MSSPEAEITALKAEIAKYGRLFDDAATPEERIMLGNMITETKRTLNNLMTLSGNVTDCDFNNPTVYQYSTAIFISLHRSYLMNLTPLFLLYIYFLTASARTDPATPGKCCVFSLNCDIFIYLKLGFCVLFVL